MQHIVHNLIAVKKRLHDYALKYNRDPAAITLLAASKTQSVEAIKTAYQAGQRIFGENYLQEALPKISALPSDIEWHFIGHIQRNKTKHIASHFAWVHSVDNIIIVKRLNDQRPSNLPPLNICIEVNLGHEESKSGVRTIEEIINIANFCKTLPNIHCRGLMAIPPAYKTFNEQRQACHQLATFNEKCAEQKIFFDTLSIGMSDDLEAAIAEKSTLVRVGTAIFGTRIPS